MSPGSNGSSGLRIQIQYPEFAARYFITGALQRGGTVGNAKKTEHLVNETARWILLRGLWRCGFWRCGFWRCGLWRLGASDEGKAQKQRDTENGNKRAHRAITSNTAWTKHGRC